MHSNGARQWHPACACQSPARIACATAGGTITMNKETKYDLTPEQPTQPFYATINRHADETNGLKRKCPKHIQPNINKTEHNNPLKESHNMQNSVAALDVLSVFPIANPTRTRTTENKPAHVAATVNACESKTAPRTSPDATQKQPTARNRLGHYVACSSATC